MRYLFTLVLLTLTISSGYILAQDEDIYLDFYTAAYEGNYRATYLLLENGINIDSADYDGITALRYAAQSGQIEIANLLIENGADVNIEPWGGQTPLIAAVRSEHFDMAELLIRNDAQINHKDRYGLTSLQYAIGNNDFYIADMLIYYDADVNCQNYDGTSALSIASLIGNDSIVNSLLTRGADTEVQDSTGNTALIHSCQNGHEIIVDKLIAFGCNVNKTNRNGFSAIHIASSFGYVRIVEKLLLAGANITNTNLAGLTPLELSLSNKHKPSSKILKDSATRFFKKPVFDKFIFSIENSFSENDYMPGLRIGLHEIHSGSSINLGYNFRYGREPILIKETENLFYQYWEKRHQFYLMLERKFYLGNDIHSHKGIITGLKEIYTFGSYRGTETSPEAFFCTSPVIGVFYSKKDFSIQFDYQYTDFKTLEFSPHRFNLTLSFSINMIKPNYNIVDVDNLF